MKFRLVNHCNDLKIPGVGGGLSRLVIMREKNNDKLEVRAPQSETNDVHVSCKYILFRSRKQKRRVTFMREDDAVNDERHVKEPVRFNLCHACAERTSESINRALTKRHAPK